MGSKSMTPVLLVVGGIVVMLALLAVLGLGLGTTTVTTESGRSVQFSDEDAVVTDKREMGGFTFLGMQLSGTDYILSVSRIVPVECAEGLDYEDTWPTDDRECAEQIPLEGTVSGLGTASEEQAFLAIEATVSKECYDSVDWEDTWPPAGPECSAVVAQ